MKFNHIHMRERSSEKDIVVCIVGDDKSCTRRYSAVNKLIVIRIILYEIEPVAGRDKLHMRVLDYGADNLPRKIGIPHFAVGTLPGNALR